MAKSYFRNTAIKGVCSVVPSKRISIDSEREYYLDEARMAKLKKTVGLDQRAVVDAGTTPGDLMYVAARSLIDGMALDISTIDALICVLDFPDYRCPPTSCVLHGRLGLPQTCVAFDINHGCAGYIYGLHVAHSMVDSGAVNRVLLLVGDTKSRTVNIKDRISAPVFGDGAAATLLERTEVPRDAWFVLGANGGLHENIMIPAGGARMPSSDETRKVKADEYGNERSLEQFYMNGRGVFDFTMSAVPANITEALGFAGKTADDIDRFVFHQANKSILQNIAIRIGVKDLGKVPVGTLAKFGNQAVASIPNVLNDQLTGILSSGHSQLLLSGFGVGLAFGTAIVSVDNIYAPPTITYQGE